MSEAKWLIKSGGRVLGPWTLDAIAEQIRSRRCSIFDEVREPKSRWMIVREHPQLAQVVRQIRDEHANVMESTQSTFVTAGKTITSSVTERILEESGLTPDPTGGMVSVRGNEKTLNSGGISGRSFGVLGDQNVQNRLDKTRSRWMIAFYALGICFILGAALVWRAQRGPRLTNEQAEEYFRLATDLASRGEFNRAQEALDRISSARKLSTPETFLKVKLLLATEGSSPIDLSRAIESLAVDGANLPVNLDLLRGLTQARLGKWHDAIPFYQKVLAKTPQNAEAILDMAAALYMSNDYAQAWNLLKTPHFGKNRSFYQLLKSMIGLKVHEASARSQNLEEFKRFDIPDEKDRTHDAGREFYFERLLLLTLSALNNDSATAQELRRKLVQANPFESKQYLRPPLLDWQIVDWHGLVTQCETLRATPSDDGTSRGIWSLCQAASGDLVDALNSMDQATRQFASDMSLAAVNALLLLQVGRKTEAERIAQAYPGNDRVQISWVRGVICEEKFDNSCAEHSWDQVRSIDSSEPRAYYGLAKLAKDLGNDSQYISTSTQGLRLAPSYRPLLQLTGGRYDF